MKKLYKSALLAALGLAGITQVHAAGYNSDLLVGFTEASGNDVVFDLGSASSLVNGETWDLTSLLTGLDLDTINWGVIGSSTGPKIAYATYDGNSINGNQAWGNLNAPAVALYTYFSAAGAGQSASMAYNDATDNSWYEQTISGPLGTSYVNENGNPNGVGLTSDLFYQYLDDGSAPTELGYFTLSTSGDPTDTLTYDAVPEPSTYGVMALGGLLAVALRRQFSRKHTS